MYLNMQNSCHPFMQERKPDNYLIMQIQETVGTNLNMQKVFVQRERGRGNCIQTGPCWLQTF